MSRTPFSNVNNIHVHSMIPEDQKNVYYVYIVIVYTHARVHGRSVFCGNLRELGKNEAIVSGGSRI